MQTTAATSRPPHRSSRGWAIGLPALAALACLGLALISIGARDFELDEAFSVTSTNQLWSSLHQRAGSMALYYVLLTPWTEVSIDPAWVRLPSALFAAAAVWWTVRTANEWFGSRVAVWTAVFMVPMFGVTRFALEARAYSLVLLLSVLSWWLFLRLERNNSTAGWIAWGLCGAGLIYAHPLAGLVIATQAIITRLEHHDPRSMLRRSIPGWTTLGLLLTPMLLAIVLGTGAAPDWIQPLGLHTPGEIATIVAGPVGVTQLGLAAALLVATVQVSRIIDRRNTSEDNDQGLGDAWHRTCLIAWLWITPIGLVLISIPSPLMRERYLIGALPAAVMVLALAVARQPHRGVRLGAGVVVLALIIPGQLAVHRHSSHPWSEAVEIVESGLDPDQRHGVLFASTASRHPFELAGRGSPVLDDTTPIWPADPWGSNLRYFDEGGEGSSADRLEGVDVVWVVDYRTHLGRGVERPAQWQRPEPLEHVGFCVEEAHGLHEELFVTRFHRCPPESR